MPVFLLGLVLAALSGGGTWALTADGQLALVVGVVVAVLTWLGHAFLILIDT
ncbi:hypothetical protein [Streptomyces sp. TRM68416]|uniref:hypothetical protein n=1 Tax=Streptomyces sp. TRM68416 TaxID=2758412 RepID=UPI00166212D6|nr:hypothetical protein [Streptomyces sp. TRM68416]MBD0838773.1 hypothetical protein [Streptomyces sp. TRM68416]